MSLPDILNKLSAKELGQYLSNYADLFISPLKVWRKVISNRTDGYNLFILHLIYYTVILFFIVKEMTLAVPLAIIEVLLILIPVLFFIVPFFVFIRISRKRIKWSKMFRLFIIIKLQFVPLLLLLFSLIKWTNMESPYIIVENAIWLIWLSFIIVFPILVRVGIWLKLSWILSNYIFFIICIVGASFALENIPDSSLLFKKISLETPSLEFERFKLENNRAILFLDESYYIFNRQKDCSEAFWCGNSQFATHLLISSILKTRLSELDTSRRISKSEILTAAKMDSLRFEFNTIYYHDLRLVEQFKDSAKFSSNKSFFEAYYNFLNEYSNYHTDTKLIASIINDSKLHEVLNVDKGRQVLLFEVDSTIYRNRKDYALKLEQQLEKRSEYSNFLFTIIFFPVEKLFDIIEDD